MIADQPNRLAAGQRTRQAFDCRNHGPLLPPSPAACENVGKSDELNPIMGRDYRRIAARRQPGSLREYSIELAVSSIPLPLHRRPPDTPAIQGLIPVQRRIA